MGKKSAGIIASAKDLAMLGLLLLFFFVKREHGDPVQFVPSSFMDAYYSDAICPCRGE
jgi:hypothetical protein